MKNRIPEDLGIPDGMCVASDDSIWVAHWGSACICHWDPSSGNCQAPLDTSQTLPGETGLAPPTHNNPESRKTP